MKKLFHCVGEKGTQQVPVNKKSFSAEREIYTLYHANCSARVYYMAEKFSYASYPLRGDIMQIM
jgi:hypothetical protein